MNKCQGEIISMSRAWDKEKIWTLDRIRTYDLPNTGRVLYPLSYGCSILRATGALSTELRVLYPLSYGRSILWVLRSSVDRAPARCLGGHRFESCPGLRFFLCPTLVKWWLFYLHIYIYILQLRPLTKQHKNVIVNSTYLELYHHVLNNGKILLCDKYILTSNK